MSPWKYWDDKRLILRCCFSDGYNLLGRFAIALMDQTMPSELPIWARDLPLLLAEVYAKTGSTLADSDKRLFDLVEWVMRLPTRNPRRVHISDSLDGRILTPYERKGIQRLVKVLKYGGDLRPFLGKSTLAIRNRKKETRRKMSGHDLFFSDWGLLHFHLGADFANTGKHVSRTWRVLIARLTEADAYLLDVAAHGKGFADVWGNKAFLEILQRNWPDTIESYRIRGAIACTFDQPIEPMHYVQLREAGITAHIEINGSVFMTPGMGIATDRTSIRAVQTAQNIQQELGAIETQFREQSPDDDAVLFVRADASVGFFIPDSNVAHSYLPARNRNHITPRFFNRLIQESGILSGAPEDTIWVPADNKAAR